MFTTPLRYVVAGIRKRLHRCVDVWGVVVGYIQPTGDSTYAFHS
ncbi:hypothetical protein LCGC14_1907810, partial [marine sediment metagenome]